MRRLIPPLIAAKELVTADHIGEGRFGLNLVCGWNEGEFEMFGATLRDHQARYEYAREWLAIVKLAWSAREAFDFDGRFFKLKGVRWKTQTLWRNPAVDHECGRLGDRPSLRDRELRRAVSTNRAASRGGDPGHLKSVRALAQQAGRAIEIFTVGVSPAGPRRGRRRTITGTPSSTMPIGRRSTIFWR